MSESVETAAAHVALNPFIMREAILEYILERLPISSTSILLFLVPLACLAWVNKSNSLGKYQAVRYPIAMGSHC